MVLLIVNVMGKLIEIKCPFNTRNKTMQEGVHDECFFIVEKNGVLTSSRTHILHPNYIANRNNWHTFLLLYCLNIKGYICANSKI